jgi:hypothetical protein
VISIYDELSAKIASSTARGPRDGARRDLGLLLFTDRDKICELWKAAERCATLLDAEATDESEAIVELCEAVEKLRPFFGERSQLTGQLHGRPEG